MRLSTKVPPYRPARDVSISWDNFRRGLNLLLKETEVEGTELVQMDNLMLVGKGVPTKRWGTLNYFLSSATGSVKGMVGLKQKDGTNQLLTITDQGVLTSKSNASYSIISGASWASGYGAEMTQLDDKIYIVNGQREVVRYSNPTLSSFPTIATPAGLFATGLSGVSGTNSVSYRVSAVTDVGETLACSPYELGNQPIDPSKGTIKVSWTNVSTASGILRGYNIYGRRLGNERFLASVEGTSNNYIDDGSSIVTEFTFPQTADTTGGVNAKYIRRFEDRLIYGGIVSNPSMIVISGRAPNQDKLDLSYGGNYLLIEPDAGDDITGLEIFEDRIIVFKERSIWQVTLSFIQVGNFTVTQPTPKLITNSHGCIASRTIKAVENDIFFLTRKGVYTLGYEPNIFNILRTNEVSAKIRPFFENLTIDEKQTACAFYSNSKYGIAIPGKSQTIVYDRERMAWVGPWSNDANLFYNYIDSDGEEHLLFGSDTNAYVVEYSDSYGDDNGTAIQTTLRTKKEDYGDWTRFKNIKEVFFLFRNVTGEVDLSLRLQERSGNIVTAKSISINPVSGVAGWGSFLWGDAMWGDSPESGGAVDTNEIYRHTKLNKISRNMQVIIQTTTRNSDYEFLSLKSRARPLGIGFLPSSEKV
jgi:hypothetical protein